jgi:hypothetical protein
VSETFFKDRSLNPIAHSRAPGVGQNFQHK